MQEVPRSQAAARTTRLRPSLGTVERLVGPLQKLFDIACRPFEGGDADRYGDIDRSGGTGIERLRRYCLAHPLGDLLGDAQIGGRQYGEEFLPAGPAHHVDIAHVGSHAGGQFLQNAVAGVVAVSIVDRLEEIDVDGKHRERLAAIDRVRRHLPQLGVHVTAVVEAGKRVRHRHFERRLHAEAQLLGIAPAADLGIDPGQQLLLVDRPDQIVVDADVEGPQQALVIVGIDDDQDRRMPRPLQRLKLRANAQGVDILHVEIDDDQLERHLLAGSDRDRLFLVLGNVDLVPARQGRSDTLGDGLTVVDDQNAARPLVLVMLVGTEQLGRLAALSAGAQFVRQHLQPHQAFHPAKQRNVAHRLGEKIIGARLEPAHPVFRLIEGRDDDHRNVLGLRIGLDTTANFDAVNPRHHHVEQHDIGLVALNRLECIGAVHGGDDLKVFRRQLGFEKPYIGENIVDDEDTGGHCGRFRNPSIVCRKLITEIGLEI
jgi:hypothetical protein